MNCPYYPRIKTAIYLVIIPRVAVQKYSNGDKLGEQLLKSDCY